MSIAIALTKSETQSRKKHKSRAVVTIAPPVSKKPQIVQRQRECLSDWNHAS